MVARLPMHACLYARPENSTYALSYTPPLPCPPSPPPPRQQADYVIVTEDTAIKNAAGAVAKVLGRVATQGHCCPVYTVRHGTVLGGWRV